MLYDLDGTPQPKWGKQAHWARLKEFLQHKDLADPLRTKIERLAEEKINDGSNTPIDSPVLVNKALDAMTSWWKGEYPRSLPHFPNGSESGIGGMLLWQYLWQHPDNWTFAGKEDPHGADQPGTQYWRDNRPHASADARASCPDN